MRKLILGFVSVLVMSFCVPGLGLADSQKFAVLTAVQTGLDGGNLAGGITSSTISMGQAFYGSTLDFQVVVTLGTTTDIEVSCEESVDGATWVWLMFCQSRAAADCDLQTLEYDVATTPNFSLLIERVRAPFMRCTFEDIAAGTGAISSTAIVGAQ